MIDYNILLEKISTIETPKDIKTGIEFKIFLREKNPRSEKTRCDLGVYAESHILAMQYHCEKYNFKTEDIESVKEMLLDKDFTPYEMMQLCYQNISRNDLKKVHKEISNFVSYITTDIDYFRGERAHNVCMVNPTIYYTETSKSKCRIDFGKYEDIAYPYNSNKNYTLFYNEDYHPYLAKNKKKRAYAHATCFDISFGRLEIIEMFLDILYSIDKKKPNVFLKKIKKELEKILLNEHRKFEFINYIVYDNFDKKFDKNHKNNSCYNQMFDYLERD